MKIGILGGAFDPVTCAHVDLAKHAARHHFDEVWLQPCYQHMHEKEMAEVHHRLEMLNFAVNPWNNIKVSTFEIDNEIDYAPTIEVYRRMKESVLGMPIEFMWIAGTDNANSIEKWHRSEELIKEVPFAVYRRKNHPPVSSAWYAEKPHEYYDGFRGGEAGGSCPQTYCLSDNVSSTLVREKVKKGEDIRPYLRLSVAGYIQEQGLYK
jgi:nicotinate-nucleotide adenylyltransferase